MVLPENPPRRRAFFIIESIGAGCIFTIEFGLRLGVCRDRKTFWKNSLNVIDFIAILPYWLDLIARGVDIPGLSVLRVTRLARVFRLLKMSRDNMLLVQTMSKSIRRSTSSSFYSPWRSSSSARCCTTRRGAATT